MSKLLPQERYSIASTGESLTSVAVVVALPFSLSFSAECRQPVTQASSAERSGAHSRAEQGSVHVRSRESTGAVQPLGPSTQTLPSEDEKRSLHYQLQNTPPPSVPLPLPPSLPFPSPSPSLPSTLPASSTLQVLSQPSERDQTAKENLKSHSPASAVHREKGRKREGGREKV